MKQATRSEQAMCDSGILDDLLGWRGLLYLNVTDSNEM